MEEKEQVRLKFFKHIIYNICVFMIIFIVFGLFVFFMVQDTIYENVDNELYESERKILELENLSVNTILGTKEFRNQIEDILQSNLNVYYITKRIVNPNVVVVVRDLDGEIINDDLGRLSEYTSEINFDKENLDKIYELTIENEFPYRGINFLLEGNDSQEDRYIQLLINVDGEKDLVNAYFRIISLAVLLGCILSILASYILSKKTLKPLTDNLIKQTEFVQNVSHELRTPLTIIQAKQELLLQEPNAKIIDKSEDIVLTLNETKRLSKLVKELLILSRADSNKLNLQKESVNIDDYLKEIILPYKEIAQMQEKEIVLDLNYKVDINIDASKIYQLMIILLDNAIKYTEAKDKIEIKTYLKDNRCNIEVKDTGIGISDEGLKRIFERFYREDRARNRETGGIGLGLSIANVIVTAHNGTIKASHNEPKGTIFTIKLPTN